MIAKQTLLVSTLGNVQRTAQRIRILMLCCKKIILIREVLYISFQRKMFFRLFMSVGQTGGSISHGDSGIFLCPTLSTKLSLFLYRAQNLPSLLFPSIHFLLVVISYLLLNLQENRSPKQVEVAAVQILAFLIFSRQ